MFKNVWITISNRQHSGQEEDNTLLFDTAGSYYFDDGVGVLTYQESELTGLEGTRTSVRVMPNQVVVDREGLISSRMIFQEGHRDAFPYETPYGQMMLGIHTRSIRHNIDENGGDVEIDYVTDLSHAFHTNNKFRISVKEMETSNG
ncbi:MAG: DUF1934 domain-containing protein [Oscillospiraceae bacterium]|nr:DUF1934 domain-containing protein [Oscillospiraceae bacterium]